MENWQKKWAYNKYWVMAHSQKLYNDVRELAKNNQWSTEKDALFEDILQRANNIPPTRATLTTTYQHIWGYFKKICTEYEKNEYIRLLGSLTSDNDELGPFLKKLAIKYHETYLLQSRIIQNI